MSPQLRPQEIPHLLQLGAEEGDIDQFKELFRLAASRVEGYKLCSQHAKSRPTPAHEIAQFFDEQRTYETLSALRSLRKLEETFLFLQSQSAHIERLDFVLKPYKIPKNESCFEFFEGLYAQHINICVDQLLNTDLKAIKRILGSDQEESPKDQICTLEHKLESLLIG